MNKFFINIENKDSLLKKNDYKVIGTILLRWNIFMHFLEQCKRYKR